MCRQLPGFYVRVEQHKDPGGLSTRRVVKRSSVLPEPRGDWFDGKIERRQTEENMGKLNLLISNTASVGSGSQSSTAAAAWLIYLFSARLFQRFSTLRECMYDTQCKSVFLFVRGFCQYYRGA